jgi:N-acetylneuraminic acid mutarotase
MESPKQGPEAPAKEIEVKTSIENKQYFFTDDEKTVIEYDISTHSFSSVDIVGEEVSTVLNFAGSLRKDDNTVYLCGGLNKYSDTISNSFLEFNVHERKFTKMPDMKMARYSFCLVLFNGKLYALGGRAYGSDQEALLRQCEVFDFSTNTWSAIAPMKERRCSFQAFEYRKELWVLGGYTDVNTRSTVIEKYNPQTNSWTKLPFKLQMGFESTHLVSLADNTVMLFGGQNTLSPHAYCHQIDLLKGTVKNISLMAHPCCLGKCFSAGDLIYLFGEDDAGVDRFQTFNRQTKVWEAFIPANINLIMSGFKKLTFAAKPLVVAHSDSIHADELSEARVKSSAFLFGTDDEPFIVAIDKNTFDMEGFACPLDLKLKNYQGACRINDSQALVAGGVNREFTKVTRNTFLVDLKTFQTTLCLDMHYQRFAFDLILADGYIYALGGRQLLDQEPTVTNRCERFDVNTKKWTKIASMNFSRSSHMTVVFGGRIYVAGGHYYQSTSLTSIESYDAIADEWTPHTLQLPLAIEAAASFHDKGKDEWVIVGGKAITGLLDSVITVKLPLVDDAPENSPQTSSSCRKDVCQNSSLTIVA